VSGVRANSSSRRSSRISGRGARERSSSSSRGRFFLLLELHGGLLKRSFSLSFRLLFSGDAASLFSPSPLFPLIFFLGLPLVSLALGDCERER
jgi:hypothetical protein